MVLPDFHFPIFPDDLGVFRYLQPEFFEVTVVQTVGAAAAIPAVRRIAFSDDEPSAGAAAHTGQQASLDEKLMFEVWSSIQGIVDSYRMKYSDYQHISLTCQIYESMKADPDKAEETRTKMLAVVEASIKGLFDDSDVTETVDDQQSA